MTKQSVYLESSEIDFILKCMECYGKYICEIHDYREYEKLLNLMTKFRIEKQKHFLEIKKDHLTF